MKEECKELNERLARDNRKSIKSFWEEQAEIYEIPLTSAGGVPVELRRAVIRKEKPEVKDEEIGEEKPTLEEIRGKLVALLVLIDEYDD